VDPVDPDPDDPDPDDPDPDDPDSDPDPQHCLKPKNFVVPVMNSFLRKMGVPFLIL
jgi:hypothetical protein